MPTCNFIFSRHPPAYHSGETVSGNVQLETTTKRSIIDICCVFWGKARVRWVDSMSRYPKTYFAEQTYIEERKVVYDSDILQIGIYDFAFEVNLPLDCPTTCNTEFGSVRYDIALEVNEVGHVVHHFKREFTVIRKLLLSESPDLKVPRTDDITENFCWWPCAAGPLHITLTLPRGGYLPREQITYTIDIENRSKRFAITGQFSVNLVQVYKFTARSPRQKTRYKSVILDRMEHTETCARDDVAAIDGELSVPLAPPSSTGTEIVAMKYEIRLQVDLKYSQGHLELAVPIVIGSQEGAKPVAMPRPSRPIRSMWRL